MTIRSHVLIVPLVLMMFGTGCQAIKSAFAPKSTNHVATPNSVVETLPAKQSPTLPSFNITGKIGVTTITNNKKQAGSAFYAWGQDKERFAIDLTGALGLGATQIRYNGVQATLTSEQAGHLVADSPEDLLLKATGWHAPITQLPFWIMGQYAPSDDKVSQQADEQGRIVQAKNGDWLASFEYQNRSTPYRIRMTHSDGHRVVLSINQTKP